MLYLEPATQAIASSTSRLVNWVNPKLLIASNKHETNTDRQGARHTFGEAAGKDIANPTAMVLCAAKMLRHVNLFEDSARLTDALNLVLSKGKTRTRDLGGYATTTDFTRAVIGNMAF